MRDVNQTASQITSVGRLHGGIGQTLTGTVCRDEVLQHRHTLLKVRQNRVLNRTTTLGTGLLRLSHQTTDTRELFDLILRTTGTGVKHHKYSIEALVCLSHLLQQDITNIIVNVCPSIDHLVVSLVICNESHVIVVSNLTYLIITLLNELSFFLRDNDIVEVKRQTCQICHTVTEVLNTIKEIACLSKADILYHVSNNATETLFRNHLVDKANFLWNDTINNHTTDGSLHHMTIRLTIHNVVNNHFHLGMKITLSLIMSDDCFFWSIECQALTLSTRTDLSDIIKTKYHIL